MTTPIDRISTAAFISDIPHLCNRFQSRNVYFNLDVRATTSSASSTSPLYKASEKEREKSKMKARRRVDSDEVLRKPFDLVTSA